ncbi:YhcN/YlaJ family sporulation lipoprotein [Lentibacillus jeotgali]|uniref:YhcN/YlaJ family sporulation lipoprotein n=1 Tax=Lentibacillus jeotgali TaxID=558169 RepID=UPI000262606B|nr:YhcN/YlaJ family sporulation lipoprotein [Lentibacillus jeotgali]
MKTWHIMLTVFALIFLISCSPNDDTSQNSQDVNFNKISTSNPIDQTAANRAKEKISRHEPVTAVNAVNTDKKLILAFEIKHNKRLQLVDIRKKMQKEMDKEFPDHKVEVSTDKRLVFDIGNLEEKIAGKDISRKKLKKEVDRLIKLMKDKT